MNDQLVKAVKELINKDYYCKEIEQKLNICGETRRRIMSEYGLNLTKAGKKRAQLASAKAPRKRPLPATFSGRNTLCWNCANSGIGGCSWDRDLIPVAGWVADPVVRGGVQSYLVRKCPKFEEDTIVAIMD